LEVVQQELTLARRESNPYWEGVGLMITSQAFKLQGKYDEGVKTGRQAVEIARKINNFSLEASATVELIRIYEALGEFQNVITLAEPILPRIKQLDNPVLEANALMIVGNAYGSIGDYTKGKDLLDRGLEIVRRLKNPAQESRGLMLLGRLSSSLGDYQQALTQTQQSLQIAQKLQYPFLQISPLYTLGGIYNRLGDYDNSAKYYQQALAIAQQFNNRYNEGIALLNLADTSFAQGNPQGAVEFAQKALTIFQEIKEPRLEAFTNRMLSIGYGELGNDLNAMESAQTFLGFSRKVQNSVFEKQALSLIGSLHRKFGRKEQAIAAYQEASAIKIDNQVTDDAYIYAGLARIYRDLNQPGVAISYYKQSVNNIEQVRRNIQGLPSELQNSFLQATVDFDKVKTADIYRQLADLLLSQGRDKEAQQVLELLKVQEIRDIARGGSATSDKPNVPLTATETKIPVASQSLIALGRQISECEQTNCNQKSALNDKLTALVDQFNQDLKKIETEIRANRATDDVFFDPTLRAKAKEIVQAQPGTVMIYPLVLENKLWLLMYSEGDVVKKFEVNVGQQELGETVVKFRKLLETNSSDINEVQKTGKQLYDWLIKDIEPELKQNQIKNLVFALDRVTRYIPMSVLFDGQQYLIENYTTYTVLSADLTDTSDRLPNEIQNTSVLAMGLSDAVPGFNPLPNVPVELDAIVQRNTIDKQGIYPGVEFLNGAFDFRTLRDNLTGHKILHLATHGAFVPGSSDKSYLLLGTGEQLTIPKIQTLTRLSNIHLVVLSACQTALAGPRQDGVEIASAAYYFLKEGAKAVMASLWLVNDGSTSVLMQQFYKNLASGTSEKPMTKAEALRQAQLSLLRGDTSTTENANRQAIVVVRLKPGASAVNKTAPGFSHPYYWAPFILIGNGL
jgi:CHAT domain-containing protein